MVQIVRGECWHTNKHTNKLRLISILKNTNEESFVRI